MKKSKRLMTLALAVVVLMTTVLMVPGSEVEAASKPRKTKITYLKSNSAGKATVKYKKVKGCKYQIQAATNSKMTSNRKTYKTSSTKKTLTLKQGRKYYVRVRTYKKIGKKTKYSSWSSKKKVTVKMSTTPGTPKITSLTSPKSGSVTVKYGKVSGCKYQVQVSGSSKMSSAKTYATTSTSKTLSLTQGKKYYVRVRAYKKVSGKTKYSKWSSMKSVTVKKTVSKPAHQHTYNIPVTRQQTVVTQVPFSQAQHAWDFDGFYGAIYYCLCDECVTYRPRYQNTSDLLTHMNEVKSPGWKEEVYEAHNVCNKCGEDIDGVEIDHECPDGITGSYSLKAVLVDTINHMSTTSTQTVTVGYKCSCGAMK